MLTIESVVVRAAETGVFTVAVLKTVAAVLRPVVVLEPVRSAAT